MTYRFKKKANCRATKTFKDICREHVYIFKYVRPELRHIKNIDKIHPWQQFKVKDFLDNLTNEHLVKIEKIIVFGSSIDMSCTYDSDLDVAVELKPEYDSDKRAQNSILRTLCRATDGNCDLLFTYDMPDFFLEEIDKHGRVVFEASDV